MASKSTPAMVIASPSLSSRTSSGSADATVPPVSRDSRPVSPPHRSKRIDQQLPIIGVHPADRLVLTAQRSHRKHVVEVPVGQQRRNRMEAVLTDHVNSVRRVHAWIDDDALPADGSSDHIAVGLPGPGGERRDKHSSENIGQD